MVVMPYNTFSMTDFVFNVNLIKQCKLISLQYFHCRKREQRKFYIIKEHFHLSPASSSTLKNCHNNL